MRWQCRYYDGKGERCENEAVKRIYFHSDHPFDHTDLCMEHLEEYKVFVWIEDLCDKTGKRILQ